ncbi:MAG TPA: DUF6114 domain-containing protein [Micromonosporaceae bacterium]|nr:DUF6114 domain-containing protein [Micromonosporaceae bacterium]
MTSAEAPAARRSALARGWRNFRRWRRGRPFWGGLFILLSGLEIYVSGQQQIGDLQVKVGPSGFLSYFIPLGLVLCGFLTWFTPAQRIFYGIIAAAIAVYSLIGANFGGFFIGMLLGIIGGSLGASWTPVQPQPPVTSSGDEAPDPSDEDGAQPDSTVDDLLTGPLTDVLPTTTTSPIPQQHTARSATDPRWGAAPDEAPPGGGPLPRRSPRLLAITLVPATLAAVLAVSTQGQRPAFAAPCTTTPAKPPAASAPASPSAAPGNSQSPSAAPSSAAANSTTSNPIGNVIGAVVTAIGNLLGIGDSQPAAAAEPTPTPSATSTAPPTAAAPAPPAPAPAQPTPTCDSKSSGGTTTTKPRTLALAAGQPLVAIKPGHMTGTKVSMSGLSFDGVTDLPTKDGTVRVLQFTMTTSTTDDFRLDIPESNGKTTSLRSTALTVAMKDGDGGERVKFYASRFEGKVFGLVDLVFTPDSPPPLTLPEMFFTDPDIQLVFVDCDLLTAPNLRALIIS